MGSHHPQDDLIWTTTPYSDLSRQPVDYGGRFWVADAGNSEPESPGTPKRGALNPKLPNPEPYKPYTPNPEPQNSDNFSLFSATSKPRKLPVCSLKTLKPS